MNTTTLSSRLLLPKQAFLFDLEALYRQLQRVKDRRKRRGVRYPLAELLMIGILAKLAGQTSSRAIAEWAQLRQLELAHLFALRRKTMPHFSSLLPCPGLGSRCQRSRGGGRSLLCQAGPEAASSRRKTALSGW